MGCTKNRWVRLFAAALVAWAALDATVSLLGALLPGHFASHGLYRQSRVQEWIQPYWQMMYPRDHWNWTRLCAVIRYGVTIAVCGAIVWNLRVHMPESR